MSWETEEVINTIINDQASYSYYRRASAADIQEGVQNNKLAPPWLYQSFKRFNGNWNLVDWNVVAQHVR